MELALVVQPPGGPAHDVVVDIDDDAPSSELVSLLASHLGIDGTPGDDLAMFDAQRQRWLADETVAGAQLRRGDAVLLARREDTRWVVNGGLAGAAKPPLAGPAVAELAVVGGVDAGRDWQLAAGSHTIGSERRSDVQLGGGGVMGRHATIEVAHDIVQLVPAPQARVRVEGRRIRAPYQLQPGQIFSIGDHRLMYRPAAGDAPGREVRHGRIRFNRPPRATVPPVARVIEAPKVPEKGQRSEMMWIAALAPAVLGLVMVLVTKTWMWGAFMMLSPVLMIAQHWSQNRRTDKKGRGDEAEFRRAVGALSDDVDAARVEERRRRRSTQPDPADVLARVAHCRPDLWERRPTDSDFLALRLGLADLPSLTEVKLSSEGREELREYAQQRLQIDRPVRAVPLAPALAEARSVGLVGDDRRAEDLAAWATLQAAALHSHRDLAIVVAVPPDLAGAWEWCRWLPHAVDHLTLDEPTVASTPEQARDLVNRLVDLVSARVGEARAGYGVDRALLSPSVFAVLHERAAESATAVDRLLAEGPEVGVFVYWIGREGSDLPGGLRTVVELPAHGFGRFRRPGTDEPEVEFVVDDVPHDLVERAGRALAPVVDVTSAAGGGGVPRVVNLLELLGVERPSSDWIASGWQRPKARLDAPIGMAAEGPIVVDLRRDGPHALVAGTTGAGKSELLQTLVASLAVEHSPQRLNFLFVDYKGGAAFAECVELPHAVGLVTDLDGRLARRVLTSLNAEVRRREHLFKSRGVKDIVEFERVAPGEAPANLLIICDEFAVLAREVPEFVDGVVDVAQRGRSLGMHLVLATQRPAGVVNDNIRANTNLRIALRVSDASDSTDVINDPAAVRIPRTIPGRAYARLGHSELIPFQAAYSGGHTAEKDKSSGSVGDFARSRGADGERAVLGERDGATDLRRLVNAMIGAAQQMQMPRSQRPWLEPLAPVVSFSDLDVPQRPEVDSARVVPVGLVDEPAKQLQRTLLHDFERDGNVVVYGGSGSGKTTALRSFALAIAARTTPDEAWIYGLDCASGGLSSLHVLPHVGGVANARDAATVEVLLDMLASELENRKSLLTQTGAASLSELWRRKSESAEFSVPPRIFVLLDGIAGFQAAFERVEYGVWIDRLQRFVAEGRPLGIHFVISADRRGAVPFAMASVIETKLIMKMAEKDELTSLGVSHKIVDDLDLPRGRALAGEVEVQFAVVGDDPAGDAQTRAIAEVGQRLRARFGECAARPLAQLPEVFDARHLPPPPTPFAAVFGIGIGQATLAFSVVDLEAGHLMVAGPPGSGRSVTLAALAMSLRRSERPVPVHLFAPRPTVLTERDDWASVSVGLDACEAAALQLLEQARAIAASPDPVVVVVDDGEMLTDSPAGLYLDEAMRVARSNLRVVAACDNAVAHRAFSGWLSLVLLPRRVILLRPDPALDGELGAVRLRALPGQEFPPGRGFLVVDRQATAVQVAWPYLRE